MTSTKTILATLIVCFVTWGAAAGFLTGNVLYERYREFTKSSPDSFVVAGNYQGYITGVADCFDMVIFDIPQDATVNQLCDVVGKYLESHPEERHREAHVLAVTALREAFPLQPKTETTKEEYK